MNADKRRSFFLLAVIILAACTRPANPETLLPVIPTSESTATVSFEPTASVVPSTPAIPPATAALTNAATATIQTTPVASTPADCPLPTATPPPPLSGQRGPLRIVFVKDGDLWLWEAGKQAAALTHTSDVQAAYLSDDGQIVAFTRTVDKRRIDLWAIHGDGSKERRLLSAADIEALKPGLDPAPVAIVPTGLTWVPGTHSLAFSAFPVFDALEIFVQDDLYLVNADTVKLTPLLPPGQGGEFVYSPDGGQILLLKPDGVDLVDADGRNRRENILPGYKAIGFGEYFFYPQLAWAGDARSLLAALPATEDVFVPDAKVAIWQVPLDGSAAKEMGTVTAFIPSVEFSPDGKYVAYYHIPKLQSNLRDLHIARTDGAADYLYTSGLLIEFLGWAPDSQHFTYWFFREGQHRYARLCESAIPLTDVKASIGHIDWVDANRFLFLTGAEGDFTLHIGTAGGASEIIAHLGKGASYDFANLLVPVP